MSAFTPKILLHVEGAVMLLVAVFAFWMTQGNWILFAVLFFAPDLSMVGYLAGPKVGAAVYNIFHNYTLPAALLVLSVPAHSHIFWQIGLIWFVHIGMDRLLGYGLKYATAFKDTHLQHV